MFSYQERLTRAFPLTLRNEVLEVCKYLPLENNHVQLAGGHFNIVDNLITEDNFSVVVEGESLTIPYRVYFNEPTLVHEKNLSELQRTIVNAVYTRHHNGLIRQKRLQKLVNRKDYWLTPFATRLLGEYVYEIIQELKHHINEHTFPMYGKFAGENPKFWQQTESRVISYWNEYFRHSNPQLKEYVGFQLTNSIKACMTPRKC